MCLQKNLFIISGEVAAAPELRMTPDNGNGSLAICRFNLLQKDGNGKTSSFLVKGYGKMAEDLARLSAQSAVLLFCRLETTKYTNREGKNASFKELVISEWYPSVPGVYINRATVAGRFTKDADFFVGTGEKKAVARTSLATTAFKGSEHERTEFIDIVTFDKKAEFISKYAGKGTAVEVTGKLVLESYTNKDNVKCVAWKVYAFNVEYTSSKRSDVETSVPADYSAENTTAPAASGSVSQPSQMSAQNTASPQRVMSAQQNAVPSAAQTRVSNSSFADGFMPISSATDGFMPAGWGNFPA